MVSVDPYKKYLNLEGVRVSYKRKDDTIHITATDPDVQASGFHLALSSGTQTEETLRELLLEHGVIRQPEPVVTTNPADAAAEQALHVLVERLLVELETARTKKDWETMDRVRAELKVAGIVTTETQEGTKWHVDTPATLPPSLTEDPSPTAAPRPRGGATVITMTAARGGVGKTTTAVLLAAAISKWSTTKRVCVIDLDLRDGTLGFLVGKTSPSALNAYLRPDKSYASLQESLVFDEGLGIYLMLAPKRARTADFLDPEFFEQVIDTLAIGFDYIILDTSVSHADPLLEFAYKRSDAICTVTDLSIGSVYGLTRWVDEVTSPTAQGGMGIDSGKIGVIVNKAMKNVGVDQQLLKQAAGPAVLLAAIPYVQKVVTHTNHNTLRDLLDEGEEVGEAIAKLAGKITRQGLKPEA